MNAIFSLLNENFAEIIIAVFGGIITYIVAPLVKNYVVPYLQAKLTTAQVENLQYWVEVAVRYYEDKIKGTGKGEIKKQQVVDFLKAKGINFTEEDLDKIIDAVVNQLNNTEWV